MKRRDRGHRMRQRPADAERERGRNTDDEHNEADEAADAAGQLVGSPARHGAPPGPTTGTALPVPVTVTDETPTIERIASGWPGHR